MTTDFMIVVLSGLAGASLIVLILHLLSLLVRAFAGGSDRASFERNTNL